MDNASSIELIKRRVSRGNKHVIKLNLVRLGRRDYMQTTLCMCRPYIVQYSCKLVIGRVMSVMMPRIDASNKL